MLRLLLPLAVLLPACTPASGEDAVHTSWRNDIAMSGWDVVSFFNGKPLRGEREWAYAWGGAEWRFSTEANRDLFALNPEAFQPEYGGYDSWAVAHGKLARSDPNHWVVDDGKLYLHFNGRTQRLWELDRADWVRRADANWPAVLRN